MTIARLVVLPFLLACHGGPEQEAHAPSAQTSFALPGAPPGITVDFIGYERARDRVWIPVGETGSVDVFDIASKSFTRVDGFKTKERESHGKKRMMGPSSVTFGDGI